VLWINAAKSNIPASGVIYSYQTKVRTVWTISLQSLLTFPGKSIVPPILTTSLTLKKASGSLAAATANVVSGPSEMMVIESAGLERRMSIMISELGLVLGVKNFGAV
jgi:hypothetical protein